VDRKASRVK